MLNGSMPHYKHAGNTGASFYYRIYNGQTEDLYGGNWTKLNATISPAYGNFKAIVKDLVKGKQYEYKAVVIYNRIPIDGDKKVWKQ
jgi:hypothetical protein